ncbi:MAG: hypothetical protein ACK5NT_02550 [Pyrinomonadaceae bacterium]
MKKFKLGFAVLTFSLAILSGIIFQQTTSANEGSADLGCLELENCRGSATCGTKGSVNGCRITCQGGDTIDCPL